MKPAIKFHLTGKCDHLKGNWWVWYCECETSRGDIICGTVQADASGEGVAEDTFEPDEPLNWNIK